MAGSNTTCVATLPMYAAGVGHDACDAWWEVLAKCFRAEGLVEVPSRLDWRLSAQQSWEHANLFFSQCCGYPLVQDYREKLCVLATPSYSAEGCDGPYYSSLIVVAADYSGARCCLGNRSRRLSGGKSLSFSIPSDSPMTHIDSPRGRKTQRFRAQDSSVRISEAAPSLENLRGARCAVNELKSYSGSVALRRAIEAVSVWQGFFSEMRVTGSHLESLRAVANGSCDVASVDCISFALCNKSGKIDFTKLRVLAQTPTAPAPPFVCRASATDEVKDKMRAALRFAFQEPAWENLRQRMLFSGLYELAADEYWENECFRSAPAVSTNVP